nr:transposase [Pseudalkalibacillus decolorationis]
MAIQCPTVAYTTQQIWIKPGHRLYRYFQASCQNAKNMHNMVNFFIRQVYTGLTSEKALHPLQTEVLETIHRNLDKMNNQQRNAFQGRLVKEKTKPVDQQKKVTCNLFQAPTRERPYVHYNFLNSLFLIIKQPDYLALPTQSSQWVMKTVFQNWKSFHASLKDYKLHPEKYKARPRIPNYCRSSEKEVLFTNQDCVIKAYKYLKFPKTKDRLNIGKLGGSGKLMQVRVIPKYGRYVVELVFKMENAIESKQHSTGTIMALDLGITNLVSGVTNTGATPFLIKGNRIKSINHYYNKRVAHYRAILRHGKALKEGAHTSRRLERLHQIRYRRLKDLFHKASHTIVNLALNEKVDTIIIGQNKDWKQEVNMGKRQNQAFVSIPHSLLITMITYKAQQYGVNVITTEESYTSKASFLDDDPIPVWDEVKSPPVFSGRRVKRGLYRASTGVHVNADLNGAANILKKAILQFFRERAASLRLVNVWQPTVF